MFFFLIKLQGLDAALTEVLLNCDHRVYIQHMYMNLKKLHRGKALRDKLGKISRATNVQLYRNA